MVSTVESEFIPNALLKGFRIDGRGLNDMRKIKIALGPPLGFAQIQLGKTRAVANVSCEIVRPSAGNATEGLLQFNTEFSPLASPTCDSEANAEREVHISRMLEKALRRARAVDTEGLCIVAGEKVWSVRIDIKIINDEGNALDCSCIAAVCALLHFKRPDVSVEGDKVIVHSMAESNPIPLSVHHIPVCVSFAFFNDGQTIVIDPSLLEEQTHQGEMTFVINMHREICTLSKAGGTPITVDQVLHCADLAALKSTEITQLIKDALNQDAKKRLDVLTNSL